MTAGVKKTNNQEPTVMDLSKKNLDYWDIRGINPVIFSCITTVNLSRNNITHFDFKILQGTSITSLNLSKNKLQSAIVDFELESLDLSNNLLTNFYCRKVQVLKLFGNFLTRFSFPDDIKEAYLGNECFGGNLISSLDAGELPKTLTRLDLSNNLLETFPSIPCDSLRSLTIYGNRLKSFDFQYPLLEEVHLGRNCITNLNGTEFGRLKIIDLSHNLLLTIPYALITYLSTSNCRVLLSSNPLSNLPNKKVPSSKPSKFNVPSLKELSCRVIHEYDIPIPPNYLPKALVRNLSQCAVKCYNCSNSIREFNEARRIDSISGYLIEYKYYVCSWDCYKSIECGKKSKETKTKKYSEKLFKSMMMYRYQSNQNLEW